MSAPPGPASSGPDFSGPDFSGPPVIGPIITGAQHLVDALAALGVEVGFGLPGVPNLSLWEALRRTDIRVIGVRHEQSAGYAADGYARSTGKLGVALVTTGPGAANILAAVGEAMASGTPILIIATDTPSTLRRPGVVRGALHEISDQQAMFAPITKARFTIRNAPEIAGTVRQAAGLALRPQSGPVYVGVPTDFLKHETPAIAYCGDASVPQTLESGPADLRRAEKLLGAAKNPLIWAGGGALRSGAGPAIGELAEKLAAPVITTFAARGLLPLDHPCLAPTPVHAPEVGVLWDEADVVLGIGTDFDGQMTQNWLMPQPPKLIVINVDATDGGKNYLPDLTLVGDARAVVETLNVRQRPGLYELALRLKKIAGVLHHRVRAEEPQAADLLATLGELAGEETSITADMCVAGHWVGGFHRVPAPRKFAYPMGWGTLGFGFPASLGVAAAGHGRAICITGDGGFLFACGELATLAQEELPVTVIIVDDGGYGMLRFDQDREDMPHSGVDLDTPDFVGLARSFGVHAERVSGFGRAFRRLLSEFLDADEPNVLVVGAKLSPPLNTSPRWYRK